MKLRCCALVPFFAVAALAPACGVGDGWSEDERTLINVEQEINRAAAAALWGDGTELRELADGTLELTGPSSTRPDAVRFEPFQLEVGAMDANGTVTVVGETGSVTVHFAGGSAGHVYADGVELGEIHLAAPKPVAPGPGFGLAVDQADRVLAAVAACDEFQVARTWRSVSVSADCRAEANGQQARAQIDNLTLTFLPLRVTGSLRATAGPFSAELEFLGTRLVLRAQNESREIDLGAVVLRLAIEVIKRSR